MQILLFSLVVKPIEVGGLTQNIITFVLFVNFGSAIKIIRVPKKSN